jgi:nitroreductase
MMLTAWAEGVGSCPNGIADAERCHAVLQPRDGEQVATIVSFGYPARPSDPERRSPEHAIARADRQPFDAVVEWR